VVLGYHQCIGNQDDEDSAMAERVTPNLEAVLNDARDLTEGKAHHANAVRVTTTDTNVYLDFYQVMPNPTQPSDRTAERVERVVLPIGTSHALSRILANKADDVEPSTLISNSLLTETDDDDIDSSDAVWEQIERLYGAWAHLDGDKVDAFFDELRDRSDTRLKAIYGDE
jgi:hypothetical protein